MATIKQLVLPVLTLCIASCTASADVDPLPSWKAGTSRDSIIEFVETVTDSANANFVSVEERIAVFDNDGTLWSEQPLYFQFYYALSRIEDAAPAHPEWSDQEPYKTALAGNRDDILALGTKGLVEIILATHSGMTNAEFRQSVQAWIAMAEHPTTHRAYSQMIFQPMLELLDYLRANKFKVYIVSGGGVEFMRAFADGVYGVPPENTIGSNLGMQLEATEDGLVLRRVAEVDFVNDKAGKPVGIQRAIGRRPIFAFGNSDGDLQMLQWTAAGEGPSFAGIVHHTDADREWAYDRESHLGRLDKALDEGTERGWTIVDMRSEWSVIYPPE
jgi:phosphoserine phosphatase